LERKRSADLVGLAADLDSNLRLVRVKPADSGTLIKLSQSLRANALNEPLRVGRRAKRRG